MKTKLRKDLFDKRITDIVGKNIYFLHAPNPKGLYLEYEIYDKRFDDYAGSKHKSEVYFIQVDIFSKSDYSELETVLEEVMLEKGYNFMQSADLYEEDTKLYHKAIRFNYKKILKSESEEK